MRTMVKFIGIKLIKINNIDFDFKIDFWVKKGY